MLTHSKAGLFIGQSRRNGPVMDSWDLKKWRRLLRVSQFGAAGLLGVSRGTIQHWESGRNPIQRTTELACRELARIWRQRDEFGPVTLVYSDDVDWYRPEGICGVLLQSECHPTNQAAILRACALREVQDFRSGFIVDSDGEIVWSNLELTKECERGLTDLALRA